MYGTTTALFCFWVHVWYYCHIYETFNNSAIYYKNKSNINVHILEFRLVSYKRGCSLTDLKKHNSVSPKLFSFIHISSHNNKNNNTSKYLFEKHRITSFWFLTFFFFLRPYGISLYCPLNLFNPHAYTKSFLALLSFLEVSLC